MEKKENKVKICEWHMCMEKATKLETYKGLLHSLCVEHRRLINKQKKADNNV